MTSVDSNFNFLCGRPHGAGPPPPVHLSQTPSPLRVDVINGWPLTKHCLHSNSYCSVTSFLKFLQFSYFQVKFMWLLCCRCSQLFLLLQQTFYLLSCSSLCSSFLLLFCCNLTFAFQCFLISPMCTSYELKHWFVNVYYNNLITIVYYNNF